MPDLPSLIRVEGWLCTNILKKVPLWKGGHPLRMPALIISKTALSYNDPFDPYFRLIVPSQVLMQVSFLSSSLNHRDVTHFDSV